MVLWIVPTWAFWVVVTAACVYGAGVWILITGVRQRRGRLTPSEIRWIGLGGSVTALAAGAIIGGGFLSGWFFAIGMLGLLNASTFSILRASRARKGHGAN